MSDIYSGNYFSIDRVGPRWKLWRYSDAENVEEIVLSQEGMDELAVYFAEFYDEDRI